MTDTRKLIIRSRDILNVTQEGFAELLGKSLRTIQRWEAGVCECSLSDGIKILQLCKEKGTDIGSLIFFYFFL